MRRMVFSMSLLLAAYCGPGMAAAPVFQLDGQQAAAAASAVYGYHPATEAAASAAAIAAAETAQPVAVLQPEILAAPAGSTWSEAARMVPVAFSTSPKLAQVAGKAASGTNASDDLLFYFLKDFKARQPQKPARWAMLLIALSLLLYQVRRRPMRTSIGSGSSARLGGLHAA